MVIISKVTTAQYNDIDMLYTIEMSVSLYNTTTYDIKKYNSNCSPTLANRVGDNDETL
jgi:hypothetical protein